MGEVTSPIVESHGESNQTTAAILEYFARHGHGDEVIRLVGHVSSWAVTKSLPSTLTWPLHHQSVLTLYFLLCSLSVTSTCDDKTESPSSSLGIRLGWAIDSVPGYRIASLTALFSCLCRQLAVGEHAAGRRSSINIYEMAAHGMLSHVTNCLLCDGD